MSGHWQDIFQSSNDCSIGQRLGICYVRSLQPSLSIKFSNGEEAELQQTSMGMLAISSVVWDAGLLLVDYLSFSIGNGDFSLGKTIDFGCGTGIAGITALKLGASLVLFTDVVETESLQNNLELHRGINSKFVAHDWMSQSIPEEILHPCQLVAASPCHAKPSINEPSESLLACEVRSLNATIDSNDIWDTILCSDILYEEKVHSGILQCLQDIPFRRLILSYKRRHDLPEQQFFESLDKFCEISLIPLDSFPLTNIKDTSLSGLYLFSITKRSEMSRVT